MNNVKDNSVNTTIEEIIDEALSKLETMWSQWQPMPVKRKDIKGPENSGVYQVRNKTNEELLLFGIGKRCGERMKTLYGGRKNKEKIRDVLEKRETLQYRTIETNCKEEAEAIEALLKSKKNHFHNT